MAGIAFLALLMAGCETKSPPGKDAGAARPEREIPFQFAQGHIFVPAGLASDARGRTFILDSGAAGILVSDTLARRLCPDTRRWERFELGGARGMVEGYRIGRVSLNLGGWHEAFRSALTIPDWETVAPHHWGTDGTLGYDLFQRWVARLDFKALTMKLIPPGSFNYSGGGIVVPLRVGEDRLPRIRLELNFKDGTHLEGEFMVDTGIDEGVLVTQGQGALPQSRGNERATPGRSMATIGAVVEEREAPLVSVILGSAVWPFPAVTLMAASDQRDGREPLTGVVGTKLLAQFRTVIFDYRRKRLILEPDSMAASRRDSQDNEF
jgi:hypothetical protein